MQRTKDLVRVLRQLVELIDDEAGRNAVFAEKLDSILAPLPRRLRKERTKKFKAEDIPDVYGEYERLGEAEFGWWLKALDVRKLRAIVKLNGFDPANRSRRWVDADKFVPLITDQLKSRLRRGSGFLTATKANETEPSN